ncbi:protein of unknown function DUF448 [Syntrophobotulus glycolicus DSM 8271]|uniref:YlxR domain-containing protein n=1 Tax=Syntrophobotulus glycolicus (strain DSM 8271 / FlGlyR) TaxID=645991 RepID=F0SU92_SYNGF|nr:YlxR family protein [Syntrophobotulus glycolicus]ADY56542.1 protein of unknown function DUF448 [Syntrophobotulus glycolicus DSM 8271]
MKTKKIPMRMCLGCQEMKPKKELLRIVKVQDDVLEFDETSKKNGRGAYLCKDQACLEKAVKQRKFQKILGLDPSEEVLGKLGKQCDLP